MSDKGTIRIPRDKFEEHNERRKEMGLTWVEYIDGEAPERGVDSGELERLVSSMEAVEERTGRIERTLDDLTTQR